jgi:hypothetical protein
MYGPAVTLSYWPQYDLVSTGVLEPVGALEVVVGVDVVVGFDVVLGFDVVAGFEDEDEDDAGAVVLALPGEHCE